MARSRSLKKSTATFLRVTSLKPDVLVVTSDHSTPAKMAGHSWHPLPLYLAFAVLPDRPGKEI